MSQRDATDTLPKPRQVHPAEEPVNLPLTYGSWMELGLAARQMMAGLAATEKLPKARKSPKR